MHNSLPDACFDLVDGVGCVVLEVDGGSAEVMEGSQ